MPQEVSQRAQTPPSTSVTLQDVERFFVHEAVLLDEWRLDEWLQLMTEDGTYLIPSLDASHADQHSSLFLIADDAVSLRSRVNQFHAKSVWAENPRSRTRRLVANFRIIGVDGDETVVGANFAVWRFQFEATDVYVGRYVYKLVQAADGRLLIRERRAILDLETLRPHGKLSFIL
jgi:p-cumate 2,3-dioxygenase beta subunit